MALIIPLSFKESEVDLYNDIKKHCSYSGWLKEAALEKMAREYNGNSNAISNTSFTMQNSFSGTMSNNNFPIFNDNDDFI